MPPSRGDFNLIIPQPCVSRVSGMDTEVLSAASRQWGHLSASPSLLSFLVEPPSVDFYMGNINHFRAE